MKDFKNFTVPLFFSEFGCNAKKPRPFTEIEAIYSTDMSSVFSGGLVYEYSEEDNEYGLVKLGDDDDDDDVTPNQDFKNLKNEFNKTENPSGDGGASKDLTGGNNCPSKSSLWNVTEEIPDTPGGAIKYLKGVAEPTGHGFDAYVQGNCHGNNDVILVLLVHQLVMSVLLRRQLNCLVDRHPHHQVVHLQDQKRIKVLLLLLLLLLVLLGYWL